MTRKFKVTVYETIIEAFDCEIELEVEDDIEAGRLEELLAEEVERVRVEGDDERSFMSVEDTDFTSEEV